MKKLILTLLLVTGIVTTKADNLQYLVFETLTGGSQSIGIDGLDLKFVDGNLVATSGDETLELELAEIAKMYFSAESVIVDGVAEIKTDNNGVEIYTVSGIYCGRFASAGEAHSLLGKGMYVVKTSGKTYKMTVK